MEVASARYKIGEVTKKPPRKKRFVFVVAAVLVLVASSGYSYVALSKTPPVLSVATTTLSPYQPEVITLPWLKEGQAAVGSKEDGVLAVSTETEQAKPIASITKIVTALAILDKASADATYTISAADVALYRSYLSRGGSVVAVKEGQTFTRTQAFQALLLASANNIADSLVNWHFASMDEYTTYANKMVKDMGMNHTTIADASGFSPQTQSTRSYLLLLAQKALDKPEISSVVAMREANIPGIGTIQNTNRLLNEPSVIGVKTGTTDEAGHCLLFAGTHNLPSGKQITLLGVVMAAPSATTVFNNSKGLLAAAAVNYQEIEVVPSGTEVGSFTSAWGQTTKLVTAAPLKTDAWMGKAIEPKLEMNSAGNAAAAGEVVGSVTIGDGIKVDVVAQQAIGLPGNLWRLAHYW